MPKNAPLFFTCFPPGSIASFLGWHLVLVLSRKKTLLSPPSACKLEWQEVHESGPIGHETPPGSSGVGSRFTVNGFTHAVFPWRFLFLLLLVDALKHCVQERASDF